MGTISPFSLLLDASGDDRYVTGGDGVGYSINRSVVLCLEGEGDDVYEFTNPQRRPGQARFDARFADRASTSIYWTEATSVGLFLDTAGTDQYRTTRKEEAGASASAVDEIGDGVSITDDAGSDNARVFNRGIFVDRADGRIDLDRRHGPKRR